MEDWKTRIDAHLRKRADIEQNKSDVGRAIISTLLDFTVEAINGYAESKLNRKQARLARKFHCHITGCTNYSKMPGSKVSGQYYEPGLDFQPGHYSDTYEDDWNKPGDMTKCSRCRQWTCYEHIYEGICMECAYRL